MPFNIMANGQGDMLNNTFGLSGVFRMISTAL